MVNHPQLLLSHPMGNANVKNATQAFAEESLLSEYWTGISWNKSNPLNAILPHAIKKELLRRSYHESVSPYIRHYPWYEAARLFAQKVGARQWVSGESGRLTPNNCHVVLDKKVASVLQAKPDLSAIYAYDHCALQSFQVARQLGIRCIYDLPIGYWKLLRQITLEEIELQPAWRDTAPSLHFPAEVYGRKDAELLLADQVIVASQFTKDSLKFLPQMKAPISVIPYGAPVPISNRSVNDSPRHKLRVLYVGGLGMRKGIPYLLDAVRQLGSAVELTLIGAHPGRCVPLDEALKHYRWIPSLPHSEILQEMERHDVFVFPSLFEGFGLVILEALSRGLPVITTAHTGGPDVLTEGVDGFIVPIRSSEAIVEKLQLLVDNRNLLAYMSEAALRKAAYCSWKNYREDLVRTAQLSLNPCGVFS